VDLDINDSHVSKFQPKFMSHRWIDVLPVEESVLHIVSCHVGWMISTVDVVVDVDFAGGTIKTFKVETMGCEVQYPETVPFLEKPSFLCSTVHPRSIASCLVLMQ